MFVMVLMLRLCSGYEAVDPTEQEQHGVTAGNGRGEVGGVR